MKVEDLAPAALEPLVDALADLRHDLGKYIRFETRFALESDDPEVLRRALQADLLATRRSGDRVEDAWTVWERLRPGALGDDPDLRAVEDAMPQLRQRDRGGPPAGLRQAAALTGAVAEATRRLHERARRAAKG